MPAAATTIAISPRRPAVLAVVVRLVGSFVPAFERHARLNRLGHRLAAAHLGALLFEDGLARQLDAIAFDGQHLHQDLVAFFQFVANIVDAMLSNFADVQQTVRSGQNLDEGPEIRQPGHFAEVSLPYFSGRRNVADHLQRLGRRFLIARGDVDLATVVHVDLHAGFLDDSANDFSAGADEVANLVGRNLHGVEARSKFADRGTWFPHYFVHLVEDEQPSPPRLLQRFTHDLRGDAHDLDVHLQRCDTLTRSSDLEIHVAVMILRAGDVGQDGIVFAFFHNDHPAT